MNMTPSLLITRVVTLLIAFTFHEYAHARVAVWLGDDTPIRDGRLTLNPLRHLDPWGALMLLLVGFGWAKPVRVNSNKVTQKNKAGMVFVAIAGPCANLLLAILGAIVVRCGLVRTNLPLFGLSWLPSPAYFFTQFIWINLSLLVLNLIPLSPLDGKRVLDYFIPDSFRKTWNQIQAQGLKILLVCFFILPLLGVNFLGNFINDMSFALYHILVGV